MRWIALVAAILVALPAAAEDDWVTGAYWLKICERSDLAHQDSCMSFLAGATFMHDYFTHPRKQNELWCPAKGVNYGQIRRVFVKYGQDRPAELHLAAPILLVRALGAAFPCKR